MELTNVNFVLKFVELIFCIINLIFLARGTPMKTVTMHFMYCLGICTYGCIQIFAMHIVLYCINKPNPISEMLYLLVTFGIYFIVTVLESDFKLKRGTDGWAMIFSFYTVEILLAVDIFMLHKAT